MRIIYALSDNLNIIIILVMYNTASLLVERLSSVPYRQFVNDNIFAPLGMASSTYNVTTAKLSGNLAEGYAVEARNVTGGSGWEKTIYRPIPYFLPQESTEVNAGAGGVITSLHDIVRPIALSNAQMFDNLLYRLFGFKPFYWKDGIR